MPTRVGCAQIDCQPGDVEANLAKIVDFARQASDRGCDVVVFPEMVDVGYDMSFLGGAASEWNLDDPTTPVAQIAAAGQTLGIVIACGVSEREGERIFNATAVFDPEKGLVASYRKTHLAAYPLFDEHHFVEPGHELTTFAFADMTWGLQICYDLRFPEMSRKLTLSGAEVLCFGSAWPFPRLEHWRTMTRSRAIENQAYVIVANRVGCDGGPTFCGESAIIDPYGVTVARASSDREELIVGEISRQTVLETRERMPVLEQRRPELY